MKRKEVKKRPTEAELEILEILWQQPGASVRQVHEQLAARRSTGYTTTLKLMQIMVEKGLVQRDTSQRSHLYTAAISREEVQDKLLQKLLGGVFRGASARLVMNLLGGDEKLRKEEVRQIREMLKMLEEE
ncbi:MAG TPA: BlaI/MecI/CopY family transcriptional regulator [Phaeodactylibacter sp.]|nr:BlaI/MecI/CopY family transcriptional regulator [Phaeodactylibacter sp.]